MTYSSALEKQKLLENH